MIKAGDSACFQKFLHKITAGNAKSSRFALEQGHQTGKSQTVPAQFQLESHKHTTQAFKLLIFTGDSAALGSLSHWNHYQILQLKTKFHHLLQGYLIR